MTATVTFANVEFTQVNGNAIRVELGQKFGIAVDIGGVALPLTWATTKDEVLTVIEVGNNAIDVTAAVRGTSKVMLLNDALNSQFHLVITVYDPSEAVALNPSAGPPLPK